MEYLNIALAKGRLANEALNIFESIGIEFDDYNKDSRKLIFEDKKNKIRVIFVKAGDVPVYVEKGASDVGIAGKDSILESGLNLYEIKDLEFGKCKFSVAALEDFAYDSDRKLRVATKYTNIAMNHFKTKGVPIEIIRLTGSVEIAPIIGLSDVIVDIVQTGNTLRENGLVELEDICDISARLIVNKVSFKTKTKKIDELLQALENLDQ